MRTKIEIKSYIKHSQKFLPYLIRHGVVLALLVVAILTFGLSMYGDKTPPVEKLEVNGIEKITDQLHLAKVPFGMESQLLDKAEIRAKFPIAKPPRLGFTAMAFLVPGETSLRDPATFYSTPPLNRTDENLVKAYQISPLSPEDLARGRVLTSEKAILEKFYSEEFRTQNKLQEHLGMHCYHIKTVSSTSWDCVGEIRPNEWANVRIDESRLSAEKYPTPSMWVSYNSRAYGGLAVR